MPRNGSSSRLQHCTGRGARLIAFAALAGMLATACGASPSTTTQPATPTPQAQGALYLFTSSQGAAGPSGTAYALGLTTGTPLWHTPLGGAVDGAALASGTLYVGSAKGGSGGTPTGTLAALIASTGKVHWQMTLPSGLAVPLAASADAVYAETLVIASTPSAPPQSTIVALRASDGASQWSAAQSGSASPPATLGDGVLYVVTANGATASATTPLTYALLAVNTSDGKALWHLDLQSPPTAGSAPLLSDGVLYLAEQYLAATGQGSAPTSTILAVRVSDGTVLWHTTPPEAGAAGNVVVSNGLVCFGYESVSGPGGGLVALHAADGSLAWQVPVASAPPLHLAAGDGMIYTQDTSTSGPTLTESLHTYNASTGKTVFDRPFPNLPGQLLPSGGGPATQAVDGVIYLVAAAVPSQASTAPAQPQSITIVLALRASDGSLEWDRTIDGAPGQIFFVAP